MDMILTAWCRTAQAFARLTRSFRRAKKQVLETGNGAVFSLGQLLRDRQLKNPLVIVGAGESRTRYKLLKALDDNDIAYNVWEELPPLPTADDGERIALSIQSGGCDCLIALGDAAVLDIAKAAAARSVRRGRSILEMAGWRRVGRRRLPCVIAVPTVGGAGAESLSGAVVADVNGNRFYLEDESLLPPVAISDPDLLVDAPREKIAAEGMDGLCRAVEAFLAAPYGDSGTKNLAAQAVELYLVSLEPCWNSGGTMRERADLLSASRLAGRAASAVGCGYIRSLILAAQTVSGVGLADACAVLLPEILEKYGSQATDRLALLAVLADLSEEGGRMERAELVIRRIRAMAFRMGLPDRLESVTAEQTAEIADLAAATANPRRVSPVVWSAKELLEQFSGVCGEAKSAAENA